MSAVVGDYTGVSTLILVVAGVVVAVLLPLCVLAVVVAHVPERLVSLSFHVPSRSMSGGGRLFTLLVSGSVSHIFVLTHTLLPPPPQLG